MSDLLFVYGTLMRGAGHPMHDVLARDASFRGDAWFSGRLYQLQHYPGAVASTSPEDKVHGQLYQLTSPKKTLAALDDYEGCGPRAKQPTEFMRRLQNVFVDGVSVGAWIYLYNRPVGAVARILSGRYGIA